MPPQAGPRADYHEIPVTDLDGVFPGINAWQDEARKFQVISGLKVTGTYDQYIQNAAAEYYRVNNNEMFRLYHGTRSYNPFEIIKSGGLDRVRAATGHGANYCGLRNYMALYPEYSLRWAHYPQGTFAVMLVIKTIMRDGAVHELNPGETMNDRDPKWISSPGHATDAIKAGPYSVSNTGVRSDELRRDLNRDIAEKRSVIFATENNSMTSIEGVIVFGLPKWTEAARHWLRREAGLLPVLPLLDSTPWCVDIHARLLPNTVIVFALFPAGSTVTFDDQAWKDAPKVTKIDELAEQQLAGIRCKVRAVIIHGGRTVNKFADNNWIPQLVALSVPTAVLTQEKQQRFDDLNRATLGGHPLTPWATVHQHDEHGNFLKDPQAYVDANDTWNPPLSAPGSPPGSPPSVPSLGTFNPVSPASSSRSRSPSPSLVPSSPSRSPSPSPRPVKKARRSPPSPVPRSSSSSSSRSRSPSPAPARRSPRFSVSRSRSPSSWRPPRSPTPAYPARRSPSQAAASPSPQEELSIINRKIAQLEIDRERLDREIAAIFQSMSTLTDPAAKRQAGSAYNETSDKIEQIAKEREAALLERNRLTALLPTACTFCGQCPCGCIVIQ